jgi:hypothetical protein
MLVKEGGRELLLITNNDGRSCLFMAVVNKHTKVLRVLEEACKEFGLSSSEIDALKRDPRTEQRQHVQEGWQENTQLRGAF